MQALKHATIFISLLGNFVFYMDVDCKNFEIAQTKRSPHKIPTKSCGELRFTRATGKTKYPRQESQV